MARRKIRVESRFNRAVVRTPGCWLWTAARNSAGYGAINVEGRIVAAHRVSWELHRGPIDTGHQVRHACGNRACVRPEHLVLSGESYARSASSSAIA